MILFIKVASYTSTVDQQSMCLEVTEEDLSGGEDQGECLLRERRTECRIRECRTWSPWLMLRKVISFLSSA